jgi:hypothetical protein
MLRENVRADGQLRCPWCQADEAGQQWVTCPRDSTPIHASCLAEFRVCPICRETVERSGSTSSRTARREPIVVRPRDDEGITPGGDLSILITLSTLPDDVLIWLGTVRRDYRSTLSRPTALLIWTAGTLLAMGTLGLISYSTGLFALGAGAIAAFVLHRNAGRPRASALVPPHGATPQMSAVATEIATRDREALGSHSVFQSASGTIRQLQAQLARQEQRRIDHHRDRLYEQMPIEDAQRIHGIGNGITSTLRAYGINNLQDLLRRGSGGIHGIGPKRSHLLAIWMNDRVSAIDRLLHGRGFAGRAELDRAFDVQLAPTRDRITRLVEEAGAARQEMVAWVATRGELRSRLASLAEETSRQT